jgi:hypothetical protein
VPVDLRSLPSGRYKIKVGAELKFVFLATMPAEGIPWYIELHHLPHTHSNSFLNPDGTLKKIKYTLQFAGRRVLWRYKTRTSTINTIVDATGEFTFKVDGTRYFISERPIPLSDAPRKSLSANTGSLVITSPLPNPRTDRLKERRDDIFTTESFINY